MLGILFSYLFYIDLLNNDKKLIQNFSYVDYPILDVSKICHIVFLNIVVMIIQSTGASYMKKAKAVRKFTSPCFFSLVVFSLVQLPHILFPYPYGDRRLLRLLEKRRTMVWS